MKNVTKLAISILGCEIIGLIPTPVTIASISTWYVNLNKPSFNPPNWLFAPVWTFLFLLMGISVYLIWKKGINKKTKYALDIFALQLVLNLCWTLIFFGLHSPLFAFVEIIILWVVILIVIIKFYKISRISAYLLIPYILWVTFASILNYSIYYLN